jgi:hypothetical protein
MAADTQMSGDFIDPYDFQKVKKIKGGLYGAAGNVENVELFFDWVKAGRPKKSPDIRGDFEALGFDGKKLIWYGKNLRGTRTGWPNAIGSGAQFAQAAMICGKTAKQAVHVAINLDVSSGGKVKACRL